MDAPLVIDESSWPPYFKTLTRAFKALNTVYTFACVRRSIPTTFDGLKKSVESLLGSELSIESVAEIKALIKSSVVFEYVDLDRIYLHEANEAKRAKKEDVYVPKRSSGERVLFFEFIDGDLTGQRTKGKKQLKMPTFSPAQLKNLINKRNSKFENAIQDFLVNNSMHDPVMMLQSEAIKFIPPPPADFDVPSPPLPVELDRRNVDDVIDQLVQSDEYIDQIVPGGNFIFPARQAQYSDIELDLPQPLVDALRARKVERLYSHQSEALASLKKGENVIVSTSTSSGKSLIYQIPVLSEILKDPQARAIYIFPTKALAQDQKRSLCELIVGAKMNTMVETFDGDTPFEDRNRIRESASVIFTNPDMIHISILPKENLWRTFLKNLKYIVVDELHVYNGLFGTHVAYIMRRLRRICATLGNRNVQFVSCSATIRDPRQHMNQMFGCDATVISEDGSPSGKKHFLCWNPPLNDPSESASGRASSLVETGRILITLIEANIRTIVFCKTRRACEGLVKVVRTMAQLANKSDIMQFIMSYRGGYMAEDRRKIEKEMFQGKLKAIIATNALEVGMDIGALDAVLLMGFPFSISSLRQQSGRAGRRQKDSLSILIGESWPIDQHYMANPNDLFTEKPNSLVIDLENDMILEGHCQCAAFEMPIRPKEDKLFFGENLEQIALERLTCDEKGFYHCHPKFLPKPSDHVSIRDCEDGKFVVVDITNGRNRVLEEIEPSRAHFTLYDGGIFMHQGHSYLIQDFNSTTKLARVKMVHVEWTTRQRDYTSVDPVETHIIRKINGQKIRAFFGNVTITMTVYGYYKLDKKNRILDAVEVDNPPIVLNTKGMWINIPRSALEILSQKNINVAASIHAAEHAILSLFPKHIMTVPGEVRTECKVAIREEMKRSTTRKRAARLTFYDAVGSNGSGTGIAMKAFDFVDVLLKQAIDRVSCCHCEDGCPECIASTTCSGEIMDKIGSTVILRSILGHEIDVESIPMGNDINNKFETVIPSEEAPEIPASQFLTVID